VGVVAANCVPNPTLTEGLAAIAPLVPIVAPGTGSLTQASAGHQKMGRTLLTDPIIGNGPVSVFLLWGVSLLPWA